MAAATAAIPEAKTRASPCSRTPTASSNAVQVALPLRPYPVPVSGAAYVEESSTGVVDRRPGYARGPAGRDDEARRGETREMVCGVVASSGVPVTGDTLPAG